jgi:hypothetical protein
VNIHHPSRSHAAFLVIIMVACPAASSSPSFVGRWEVDSNLGHGDRMQFALRLESTEPGQVRGLVGLFGHTGWVTWIRGNYHGDSINLTMLNPCQTDSLATPVAIGFRGIRVADSNMLRGEVWDERPEAPWVLPVTLRRGLTPWMEEQFREFERECHGAFPTPR